MILVFIMTYSYAQQARPGQPIGGIVVKGGKNPGGNLLISASGGGIFSTKTFADDANVGNGLGFNLNLYVPILELSNTETDYISLGVNAGGSFMSLKKNDDNNTFSGYNIIGQSVNPTFQSYTGKDTKRNAFLAEAGVQTNFSFDRFTISPIINLGYLSMKEDYNYISQTSSVNGQTRSFDIITEDHEKSDGLAFIPKLRLSYFPGKLGFFVEGSYMSGPQVNSVKTIFKPNGTPNEGGYYNIDQMLSGKYTKTESKSNFSAFGVNVGVTFALGKSISEKGLNNSIKSTKNNDISPDNFIKQQTSPYASSTSVIPKRVHTRIFCVDGKQVLRYYNDKSIVTQSQYSNLPCDPNTWPIDGKEGDFSVQYDSPTKPIKSHPWNGNLLDLFNIPDDRMIIPISKDINEVVEKINKSTNFTPSLITDQKQTYLKLVKQENQTYLSTFLPIDTEGPIAIIKGYHYSCTGTCHNGCSFVSGNCAPCSFTGQTCYEVKTGDNHFYQEVPVRNIGNINVVDLGDSQPSNPKLSELKKHLDSYGFEINKIEMIEDNKNKILLLLVSNGKTRMILFNKIENDRTSQDWISYYNPDVLKTESSMKEILIKRKQDIKTYPNEYIGHLKLLK